MDRRVYKRNIFKSIIINFAPLLFTFIIIGGLFFGFRQADESSQAEGIRLLEEALMRVIVHSYAVNGHFPESLEYIVENYDIFIDRTRYFVNYDVFASNIPPVLTIFEIGGR
jgi:hypothetical protein